MTYPPLPPRQLAVLRLIAEGCTSRAIAVQLHISYRVARHTVGDLLAHLDVTSRAAAVAVGFRQGWLT